MTTPQIQIAENKFNELTGIIFAQYGGVPPIGSKGYETWGALNIAYYGYRKEPEKYAEVFNSIADKIEAAETLANFSFDKPKGQMQNCRSCENKS